MIPRPSSRRRREKPHSPVTPDPIDQIGTDLVRFAEEPECKEMVRRLSSNPVDPSTFVADQQPEVYTITDSSNPLPGEVGRFRITELLGQGSFGRVYKARDPLYERIIALKVIHPGKVRDIDRVLNEAKATVKIRDRRIVRAYEVAKDESGSLYIAMEYVGGGSLRSRMLNGAIHYKNAVELMESIADAVSVAHSRGFVHRDIKPENILFDDRGNPKIADFGLVLSVANDSPEGSEIAGAPPYMSPEQVQGELASVDKRSDIWSLGVVFYEMLTGSLPFAGSRSRIFEQIREESIIPPQHLNHGVPPRVARICMKCLQKNPNDRFQTASQLVNALYRCKPAEHRQALQRSAPVRYSTGTSGVDETQLITLSVAFGVVFGIILTLVVLFLLAMNPENDISGFIRDFVNGKTPAE